MRYLILFSLALWVLFTACSPQPQGLPILGNHDFIDGDTVYHVIPDFSFTNQDSLEVTNATFAGKAYVVDFFFTSCPTICPKVKKQMLRLYERYEGDNQLLLLSHTIDTKRDSVERLKRYAENLEVTSDRWHFVTGDRDIIYEIAEDYFSIAREDPNAPGGFDHSGWLILVDDQRHIRSFCDGTNEEKVTKFMDDIDLLLEEMEN